MPTTQASKRQKTSAAPSTGEASDPHPPTQLQEATTRKPKAPPEVPIEIFTEILSYFYAIIIPKATMDPNNTTFPRMYQPSAFERPRVLRALSQTCRLWRYVLYSLHWEHVVCTPESNEEVGKCLECLGAFFKDHLAEASLVRALTIKLPRTNRLYKTPLWATVKLLKVLKNLHTLQIVSCDTPLKALRKAFTKQAYPNIRTVILPADAYTILRTCKNAKTIICTSDYREQDEKQLYQAIENHCKDLEAFGAQGPMTDNGARRIARALPGLRAIMMPTYSRVAPLLQPLKNLSYIELLQGATAMYEYSAIPDYMFEECIQEAKPLLHNQEQKSAMVVRVTYAANVIPVSRWICLNMD